MPNHDIAARAHLPLVTRDSVLLLLPAPSSHEPSIKSFSRQHHAASAARPQADPHDDVFAAAAAQRLHVVAHDAAVDDAATSFAVGVPVHCHNLSLMEALVTRT